MGLRKEKQKQQSQYTNGTNVVTNYQDFTEERLVGRETGVEPLTRSKLVTVFVDV